jgi:hypothetical protein
MSSKDGAVYKVVFSGEQRRQIHQWSEEARQLGLPAQFLADLKQMSAKLAHDPYAGERSYQFRVLGLKVRRLAFGLLTVYYGVDEQRHIVFVQKLFVSGGFGFPNELSSIPEHIR